MDSVERKLETLKVAIFDDEGERVGQIEVQDPRERIVSEFNEMGEHCGLMAKVA